MLKNEGDLYAKIREVLLHFPTIRWIQKAIENDKLITKSNEKIHLVQLPYWVVLRQFTRGVICHSEIDGVRARERVTEAKAHSNNVLSWQKLHYLLNSQERLYMFREPTGYDGIYVLYILTLEGWTFTGIKTNVIE